MWFFKRLSYKIKDLIYDIKYLFQRIFRGYSDIEMWNLCDYLAKYNLKYLKIFKKMYRNGYPADLTEEGWEEILDKMIWSLENYDKLIVMKPFENTEEDENKLQEELKSWKGLFGELNVRKMGKMDHTETDRLVQKFNEGMDLFGKYFFNLWD